MAKRFLDTELWEKEWFMNLETHEKTAMLYVFLKCDNVGVWKPNYKLGDILCGTTIDWDALRTKCNGNVELLDKGKWWLVDFCDFQYNELNDSCPPHRSYILKLKKYGLYDRVVEGYAYPTNTPQEKDKDKNKAKVKEKKPFNKVHGTASLTVRKRHFTNEVHDYVEGKDFSPRLVVEFISYWTEPNQPRTRLAFEMEKKWSLARRLGTWRKNDFDGYQAEFDEGVKKRMDKVQKEAETRALQENSADVKDIKQIMEKAKQKLSRKYSV